ncbi:MAG: patatin-like phospholipase family protein [Pseudolabrys sp.]|nr:patatin-like phospholipase family protein [Pseudolabrys sp.]MCW5685744.1 patatin-like phospholipase family protein [Pseudolabrys sp.]
MVFEGLFGRKANDRATEATTKAPAQPALTRPSIGLALGGGAARGFAHIGVMRALRAHGIEPDVIVGTSIGAVVGGCYAAGQFDNFEEWARGLNFRGMLGYFDLSLSRAGLISGTQLARRLEAALGTTHIEDLKIRFAAIATEISTGHEIWLTHGRLVDALRASYALPGIFTPVRIGGRWLVDGALVNPVPVSAARSLGARLVIAVNLNSEMFARGATVSTHGSDDFDEQAHALETESGGLRSLFGGKRALRRQFLGGSPSIPTVMVEAFNVMQDRITRARLAGEPPDVTIAPRIAPVGWFDFHRAEDAIRIGEEATERAIEDIRTAIAALSHPEPIEIAAK